MDELLSSLELLTDRMEEKLGSAGYTELERFVEERGLLVEAVGRLAEADFPSSEQRLRVGRLLERDIRFMQTMRLLQEEASLKLERRTKARVQLAAYESSYDAEAFLMDTKK
ncbi:hypothetical protein SAMN05444162_2781 [Paenibacillaceae bacterium GAS479]|nr:hypothetical protein SAMN05444162_2781 [Paenibacillaceae bacterium GAS479]